MNLRYEPVRVFGWVVAIVSFVNGVVSQVGTDWDASSGWKGLGLAVVAAVGAEITRRRTRSRAFLEDTGRVAPSTGGAHFADESGVVTLAGLGALLVVIGIIVLVLTFLKVIAAFVPAIALIVIGIVVAVVFGADRNHTSI